MGEEIEVVYEDGAPGPLAAFSECFQEQQRPTLSVEDTDEFIRRIAEADLTASLEAVNQTFGKKLKRQCSCNTHFSLRWRMT